MIENILAWNVIQSPFEVRAGRSINCSFYFLREKLKCFTTCCCESSSCESYTQLQTYLMICYSIILTCFRGNKRLCSTWHDTQIETMITMNFCVSLCVNNARLQDQLLQLLRLWWFLISCLFVTTECWKCFWYLLLIIFMIKYSKY